MNTWTRCKRFSPRDGPLKAALPSFEERSEQLTMATSVGAAIADGENLVVEAGTGVGKSIAYLAGAALHASQGRWADHRFHEHNQPSGSTSEQGQRR